RRWGRWGRWWGRYELRYLSRIFKKVAFEECCQSIQQCDGGDAEDTGKFVGRDLLTQVKCSDSFKGHKQFGCKDICSQFTLATRIIELIDAEHLLHVLLLGQSGYLFLYVRLLTGLWL